MSRFVFGGSTNYGQVAGILMLDSTIPRIPGDPGHAATFDFPIRYGVVRDFPFEDLVEIRKDHLDQIIKAAIGAVVLECTNLITFRSEIQQQFNVPVFDLVSLMEFFADGYRFRDFTSRYIPADRTKR